ncbi:uncharacterized protein LOC130749368 [Lotus japonicus]|uniref:uncharacterized protein LOC130749368 n=1 Tax=Lotus japonicus TaxID=34305 RepID=UPI002582F326|nr:uncharacterized protein LOC130749368 [Lotus japonicus]
MEMESNAPAVAKRVWSMVRVVYFMLRKGILKGKLMMDLKNIMLKRRGKLAGKAIANLMFHHGASSAAASRPQFSASREYEFSCSNTPNYNFFSAGKRNRHNSHHNNHFFTCAHAPPTQDDEVVTANAVKAVLEMLNNETEVFYSPALPGFGPSPSPRKVRQLRVTDSPFPLREAEDEKDNQVDKAAEEFIKRFYKDLRKQD